jgi:hypothetical protein
MLTSNQETVRSIAMPSLPSLLVRAESVAVALGAIALYASQSGNWLAFILLLFVPDVSMVGYLANPRLGSFVYNTVHTYVLPAALIAISLAIGFTAGIQIALIWFAHIGMDRTLGFGLKYPTAFKDSHLQRL